MPLASYTLKEGVGKHWIHGICYRPGDKVPLSSNQAEAIRDKLVNIPAPKTLEAEPFKGEPKKKGKSKKASTSPKFVVQKTKDGFNVVDKETLELANKDGPLAKAEAVALADVLVADVEE